MPRRKPKTVGLFTRAVRRLLPARKTKPAATQPIQELTGEYPVPVDPSLVGTWPALTKSGGGFFYDEVLEYRVWVHPEAGGEDLENGDDYYLAFAIFEEAASFAASTRGAEMPLALVRQHEWVNEPEPGVYQVKRGERITEWRVEWLLTTRHTGLKVRELLAQGRVFLEDTHSKTN